MTSTTRSLLVALIPALALSACVNGPPPPPDSIYEGRATRYGAGSERDSAAGNRYGAGSPAREAAREESRNRFGYATSEEDVTVPAPAVRERTDRRRDRVVDPVEGEEIAGADDKPAMAKPEPEPEPAPRPKSSGGQPSLADIPYAKGVPGNPLAVTVPGYSYVGQISIEKLDKSGNPSGEPQAPGTAVQIPDPKNPGKTIYFRVP